MTFGRDVNVADPNDPTMNLVYLGVDLFILAVFLPLEVIMLVKIRFAIEFSVKLILLAFTTKFVLNALVSGLCLDPQTCSAELGLSEAFILFLRVTESFADRLKWLVIYFFILEMQEVRIKVECDTHNEL